MEGLTAVTLAAPSPSPTAGTGGGADLPNATFWLVIAGLIGFFAVVRAVNRLLGWGSQGDQ